MIPCEKQCVSLELAKRHKEPGVAQENVCYWLQDGTLLISNALQDDADGPDPDWTSAFTVAELGEMLPYGA